MHKSAAEIKWQQFTSQSSEKCAKIGGLFTLYFIGGDSETK